MDRFDELRRTGKGMYIYGNTGSGTTHLSAAVANALIEQGYVVRFQDVNQLYYWIKSTYRKGSEENESDYIQPCIDASLLILDDLGAETPTDWTMATMHHIINSRIDALRPTIITSNLKPEDLGNALSVRTVNRILDTVDCPFEVVSIVCESYRTSGGHEVEPLRFTVPLNPVTKKNSRQAGHRPSAAYVQYERDAVLLNPWWAKKRINTRVNIKAIYYMKIDYFAPNCKALIDITNLHSALHDTLVSAGVLEDDNVRVAYSMDGSRVDHDSKYPRTEIEITPIG